MCVAMKQYKIASQLHFDISWHCCEVQGRILKQNKFLFEKKYSY
jgi:hypothetical protein